MGCASHVIKMPEPLPEIISLYKTCTVIGGTPGMSKTGIYVNGGDPITVIAKGEIDLAGKYTVSAGRLVYTPHGRLLIRVGKTNPAIPYFETPPYFIAPSNGEIYLGYIGSPIDRYGEPIKPDYYSDDTGFFIVDIIVWKKLDTIQIANFFELIQKRDPKNKKIEPFVQYFKRIKEFELAQSRAIQEIEETKKALTELENKKREEEEKKEKEISKLEEIKQILEIERKKIKEEVEQTIKAHKEKELQEIREREREEQIIELKKRLSSALEALKELEDLKKKLTEESLKSKYLEERLEYLEQEKIKVPKTPPMIVISSPRDGIRVEDECLSFSGVIEDDQGISVSEFFLNQQLIKKKDYRRVAPEEKQIRRIEFLEKICLKEGKNEITVMAQDVEGIISKKNISVFLQKKQEEVWGVVIGINQYKHFPHLKYAVNDAREFYKYLIEMNRIPKDHIILVLDDNATLERLRSLLGTQLRQKAGKNDMVIIYFAGHGATEVEPSSPDGDGLEKYILPYNADPKDLYATAMPMNEIARIFQRIPSEKVIFISDTCYSGASGGRTIQTFGLRATLSGAFLDRLSQGKGRIILTASDANELSIEKDELGHGVFTYYLLEALRGKGDLDGDKLITVDEVHRYVSIKVPQATDQKQHPVKKGEMKGQIVLGRIQ